MHRKLLAVCAVIAIVVGGGLAYYDNHPYCGITEEDSAAMGDLIRRLEHEREERELKLQRENANLIALTERIVKYCQLPTAEARELAEEILAAALRFDLSPSLLCGIMIVESHGQRKAKNKHCVGLMQVNSRVWHKALREAGINDIGGIESGAYILSTYLRQTNGNLRLALARYSGGARGYADKVYRAAGKGFTW